MKLRRYFRPFSGPPSNACSCPDMRSASISAGVFLIGSFRSDMAEGCHLRDAAAMVEGVPAPALFSDKTAFPPTFRAPEE